MPQNTENTNATPRHILITGASGGLGKALAAEYAAEETRLTLWGRNAKRLAITERSCREKGSMTEVFQLDIRERERAREELEALAGRAPVDLAVLNAGVLSGGLEGEILEPVEDACRIMEVNATGTINMAAAILEHMLRRGSGHIVFISSAAARYPLRDFPAYSASKVAISYYARAVKSFLSATPIRISVVYPGYLDTAMGRRIHGIKLFVWSPEKAAAFIRARLEAGSDNVAFPVFTAWGTRLLHAMPRRMADFFLERFRLTVEPDDESPMTREEGTAKNGTDGTHAVRR